MTKQPPTDADVTPDKEPSKGQSFRGPTFENPNEDEHAEPLDIAQEHTEGEPDNT